MSDYQYDVLIADDEHYQEELQRKHKRAKRKQQTKRHYGYDHFGPEYDDIRIRKKWRKRHRKRKVNIEEMYD